MYLVTILPHRPFQWVKRHGVNGKTRLFLRGGRKKVILT
jgi:hypothetical protein